MKKIITLFMALTLILAAVPACADDVDPIVGAWYVMMNVADGPMTDALGDYTHLLLVFVFEEDGRIWTFEADFMPTDCQPRGPSVNGEWIHDETGYITRIISLGEGKAYLEGDLLYIKMTKNVYYIAHRMTPMNWYADIVSDTMLGIKNE